MGFIPVPAPSNTPLWPAGHFPARGDRQLRRRTPADGGFQTIRPTARSAAVRIDSMFFL